MGSYFGEDYTAKYLLRLGRLVEEKIAQARYGKSFADLAEEEQYLARKTMQRELQSTDLSAPICVLSTSVSDSIVQLKQEIASTLLNHDAKKGWTKAYSLDEQSAVQTADFLDKSMMSRLLQI